MERKLGIRYTSEFSLKLIQSGVRTLFSEKVMVNLMNNAMNKCWQAWFNHKSELVLSDFKAELYFILFCLLITPEF